MNTYQIAITGMENIWTTIDEPMKRFTRNGYASSYQEFYSKLIPVFDALEEGYTTVLEPDTFLKNMADALVGAASNAMSKETKKFKAENLMFDFNLILTVYIFPCILQYQGKSSKPLVEEIKKQWKLAFPDSKVEAADYDQIKEGFKHKFCYITTAVCSSFGKPDNCYELNLFREFRDRYLMNSPQGRSEVEQYYDLAPTIIKHINACEDRDQIYAGIWEEYLKDCQAFIEQNDSEACSARYHKMVADLKEKYFYCN